MPNPSAGGIIKANSMLHVSDTKTPAVIGLYSQAILADGMAFLSDVENVLLLIV